MKTKSICGIAALGVAAVALGGCMGAYSAGSGMMMSDASLATKAAGQIGVMPNEVTVTDRRVAEGVTYYTATARDVAYICQVMGGGVLAYGVSSGATCVRRQ